MGFTRTQIIEIANRRTEKRGAALDLPSEFLTALQEVCLHYGWWWRKKIVSFTVKSGISQYALEQDSDGNGIDAPDFHQMTRDGFKIWPTINSYACVDPVFGDTDQQAIIALQSQLPAGMPTRFFIMGGGAGTVVVDPVPNSDVPASISYMAVPTASADSSSETIPLVPHYCHNLIIKRLEMHILAFTLGEGNQKYIAASKEFDDLALKAFGYPNFADGEVRSMASQDANDAVQSS